MERDAVREVSELPPCFQPVYSRYFRSAFGASQGRRYGRLGEFFISCRAAILYRICVTCPMASGVKNGRIPIFCIFKL